MAGHLSTEPINVDNSYNLSIASFALDTWTAGSLVLRTFIFVFAGVSSYAKQLILLVWCTSPPFLSVSKRGIILCTLEDLGKWSMIDLFSLINYFSSLRISLLSPAELPTNFYNIDLRIIPGRWVFGAYAVAQLI